MARIIRCTLVEVADMSESAGERPEGPFEDLVPGADPYIVALMAKLRKSAEFIDRFDPAAARFDAKAELPPPFPDDDASDDADWTADWSPRNWPRH